MADSRTTCAGLSGPKRHQCEIAAASAEKCEANVGTGNSAYDHCLDYLRTCYAKPSGPYSLTYRGQVTQLPSREECVWSALFYSRMFKQSNPQDDPAVPKPTAPEPTVSAPSANEHFKPDGKTMHAIGIKAAGFFPEISSNVRVEDLTLRFGYDWEIFGVEIRIAYRVERTGTGSYLLKYLILSPQDKREEIAAGELKDSISFRTDGPKILDPIGFGVTLRETGNFENVSSVRLVNIN